MFRTRLKHLSYLISGGMGCGLRQHGTPRKCIAYVGTRRCLSGSALLIPS